MWTEEDSKKSSKRLLVALLKDKDEYIQSLGKERYERAIAELRERIRRDDEGSEDTKAQQISDK